MNVVAPKPGGMEAQARQAAIDAVEGRWRHDQDVARKAHRRKVTGNIVSAVVLLVILVAIVLYFKAQRDGGKLRFGMEEKSKAVVTVVKEAQYRVEYKRAASLFDVEKTVPWKKAPASVKPKNVPAGTKYYARIIRSAKADDFDLYEMTKTEKGMSVARLSPTGSPVRVGEAEFRKARARASYLVAYDGTVYVCDAMSGGE